jgi:hypothetical protein
LGAQAYRTAGITTSPAASPQANATANTANILPNVCIINSHVAYPDKVEGTVLVHNSSSYHRCEPFIPEAGAVSLVAKQAAAAGFARLDCLGLPVQFQPFRNNMITPKILWSSGPWLGQGEASRPARTFHLNGSLSGAPLGDVSPIAC